MTIAWVLKLRVHWIYREVTIFNNQKHSNSNENRQELVITCRNLLMPGFSGVNFWVENLARALSKDFQITIYCQGRNLLRSELFLNSGVSIIALPIFTKLRRLKLPLYSAWNSALKKELLNHPKRRTVISPLSGIESYGLTQIHGLRTFTLLVTDERTHRFPNLSTSQILDYDHIDHRTSLIVSRESEILNDSGAEFLADSNEVIEHLQRLFSMKFDQRVSVLPINIMPDNCEFRKKENIIFFIGRCDLRKDLSTLLNSWEMIHNFLPSWTLVVATSGGDDHETFRRVSQMAKKNYSLKLLLNVDEFQKHEYLAKSKIVVYPSRYESFGIVALESMQHGCVTIASNIGGLPEVLDNAGVLFEVGSDIDLGISIVSLIRDTSRMKLLMERSLKRAEHNFSDDLILERFLENFPIN
jgi:glycosyltransferase involved in cell wall biosynthesis